MKNSLIKLEKEFKELKKNKKTYLECENTLDILHIYTLCLLSNKKMWKKSKKIISFGKI